MRLKDKIYELAGDDYALIQNCEDTTRSRFFQLGIFVPLLLLLSLVSSYLIFNELLDNQLLIICLSLFFAWMLTNIYRLLLYTLTRSALPDIVAGISYSKFSLAVRVVFVCFISLLISMPIESGFYAPVLNKDMSIFRKEEKIRNASKIQNYYNVQYEEISRISCNDEFRQSFYKEKEQERIKVTTTMYHLVDSSNHYLQRLRILNTTHTSCWLIAIFFMIFFSIPIYLKHSLRKSDYYEKKGSVERRIVELNYYAFKKKYTSLMYKNTGNQHSYSEPYTDAPYNTVKKTDRREYLTEDNLLSELYNA